MDKMKRVLVPVICLLLLGCSKNNNQNNCNFLLDLGVNLTVNLNLPEFSQLQFTGNAQRVNGQGNGGIIIARVGSETIRAWDAADPNHAFASCSVLEVNGLSAKCGCDDANEYELLSGQNLGENPEPCTLLAYRVEAVGNNQYLITDF
jgi:hypothetical protein